MSEAITGGLNEVDKQDRKIFYVVKSVLQDISTGFLRRALYGIHKYLKITLSYSVLSSNFVLLTIQGDQFNWKPASVLAALQQVCHCLITESRDQVTKLIPVIPSYLVTKLSLVIPSYLITELILVIPNYLVTEFMLLIRYLVILIKY